MAVSARRTDGMAKAVNGGRKADRKAQVSRKRLISAGLSWGISCGRRQKDGGPKGSGRAVAKNSQAINSHARPVLALRTHLMGLSVSLVFDAIMGLGGSCLMGATCHKGREAVVPVFICLAVESRRGAQTEKREGRRPRPIREGPHASP